MYPEVSSVAVAITLSVASQCVFTVVDVKCNLGFSNSWTMHLHSVLLQTQKHCVKNM
jgi:hypothetical protein